MDGHNAPSRPLTPPQSPIYNVYITSTQVELILKHALPSTTLIRCEQLPSGSSYNNRLYNLTISPPISTALSSTCNHSLILKITGRFWKHFKTLNEATCLQLLARYPMLPVPRVVAFSADSSSIAGVPFEWILMTKMPGLALSEAEPDDEDADSIVKDLLDFMHTLRTVPSPGKIGNLIGLSPDGSPHVGKLVDIPDAKGWPYKSHLKYQTAIFEAALASLENDPIYAKNAQSSTGLPLQLRKFIDQILPNLMPTESEGMAVSVLTHADLSLHNILVSRPSSDSPLRVSAVVDWEFSGYFPPYEERLVADSDLIRLNGKLMAGLFNTDDSMPPWVVEEGEQWELMRHIYLVRENIAPWWVRGLDLQSTELRDKLAEAEATIVETISGIYGSYGGLCDGRTSPIDALMDELKTSSIA